jgi:cytosine deaminase
MPRWPPRFPATPRFALRDAAVSRCLLPAGCAAAGDADGLARVDIAIEDGRIADVLPVAPTPPARRSSDAGATEIRLDGCQVWPAFVDLHTHLDKGHIWPRAPNVDGTFDGALGATMPDRAARWNDADVAARFEFGLRAAYAHGTAAIRTHLDSISPQHRISWPVFARLRERWAGRIDLQAVTILLLEYLDGAFGDELADTVAAHRGVLGAVIPAGARSPMLERQLDRIFRLAAARGLDLDFHADENGDPESQSLLAIAEAVSRNRFGGRVVVGHCCSVAVQSDAEIERTLSAVAAAGIAVVSLPMCNLFLQDRVPRRTPRWRGVTLLHEMRARGIAVSIASDNCRDPFYGYGDHDMLEVYREATRIAQLDRPVGDWPAAVTRIPASVMRLEGRGRLVPGGVADLVLFNARGYSELLSRPQSDRIVLRDGLPIDTTLPDYRELDPLMHA